MVLLAGLREAEAGDSFGIPVRIACADAVVELTLVFDRPIPSNWRLIGERFPPALAVRAKRTAKVTTVAGPLVDAGLIRWDPAHRELYDRGWWRVHQKGRARMLLFLHRTGDGHRAGDGRWTPLLVGVNGYPTDVTDPKFEEHLALVREAWQDPGRTKERCDQLLAPYGSSRSALHLEWGR